MTQRELSRAAKVSHTQISRYESGEATPRPGVLIRLAVALNTTLEFLRQGTTEDESVSKLEEKVGPLNAGQDIEFSEDEYRDILKVCEITGMSLPEMTRLMLLLGMREELTRNRDTYAKGIDVDEMISSLTRDLEKTGHATIDSILQNRKRKPSGRSKK